MIALWLQNYLAWHLLPSFEWPMPSEVSLGPWVRQRFFRRCQPVQRSAVGYFYVDPSWSNRDPFTHFEVGSGVRLERE